MLSNKRESWECVTPATQDVMTKNQEYIKENGQVMSTDFLMQTDKMVMTNQPGIMVVNKLE